MAKIFRGFTIDFEVYEAARRSIPNMSEVVEAALRDRVSQINEHGVGNPFKGVSRRLLNKAASVLSYNPSNMQQKAEIQANRINTMCNTSIQPQDLINYVNQTEIIR